MSVEIHLFFLIFFCCSILYSTLGRHWAGKRKLAIEEDFLEKLIGGCEVEFLESESEINSDGAGSVGLSYC